MKIDFGKFSESEIKDGKTFYVYMHYTEGSTTVNWNPLAKNKYFIKLKGTHKDNENQIEQSLNKMRKIYKENKFDRILINIDHLGNNGVLSRLNAKKVLNKSKMN